MRCRCPGNASWRGFPGPVYANQKPKEANERDLLLKGMIDEESTRHPFYGSRRMVVFLKAKGQNVNRKRVQSLMKGMGLIGMAPGPNTSRPHPEHNVYPYLLRGVPVVRPNQVSVTADFLTHPPTIS